jgi:hypothetical protein
MAPNAVCFKDWFDLLLKINSSLGAQAEDERCGDDGGRVSHILEGLTGLRAGRELEDVIKRAE